MWYRWCALTFARGRVWENYTAYIDRSGSWCGAPRPYCDRSFPTAKAITADAPPPSPTVCDFDGCPSAHVTKYSCSEGRVRRGDEAHVAWLPRVTSKILTTMAVEYVRLIVVVLRDTENSKSDEGRGPGRRMKHRSQQVQRNAGTH